MRILFIGNHAAPYSTESDIRKTLEQMGHQVDAIQESPGLNPLQIVTSAKQPLLAYDRTIWMHTHGWDWHGMDMFVEAARPIAITLDLFRGLARHDPKYVETHPWFKCKYFFQPDEPDWLREHGVNAFWSPPAVLEDSCYVAELDKDHEAFGKVVFVGSRQYHPEWPWRAQLVDFLEKRYKDKFVLYEHSSGLRGDKLNRVYANAAVVVGDSCFASPESAYTSDRLFETLGRGGNLIYPRINYKPYGGLQAFVAGLYDPGNFDELEWQIEESLGWFERAEYTESLGKGEQYIDALRYQSSDFIKSYHTYANRLEAILKKVGEEEGW